MEGVKILNSVWFNEMGGEKPIGIVLCEVGPKKEKKAYIGTGYGNNQRQDEAKICEGGAKFPVELAVKMMEIARERSDVLASPFGAWKE